MQYRVTNVIQGQSLDAGEPVTVDWYTGDDLATALSAMVQGACHGRSQVESGLPEHMRFRVLSVHLDITPDEPEPLADGWRRYAPGVPTEDNPVHVSLGGDATLCGRAVESVDYAVNLADVGKEQRRYPACLACGRSASTE